MSGVCVVFGAVPGVAVEGVVCAVEVLVGDVLVPV
jgi:hypothetical protein